VAALALGWATVLGTLVRRRRPGALPVATLGALLTLYPAGVRWIAPAVAALHSERDAARMIAAAGSTPVILFGIRDPSLTFYLESAVIHTDDLALARDVFESDGPAFLVTSRAHVDEVEHALGPSAHVWHATRRRRLYANRPPPGNGSR